MNKQIKEALKEKQGCKKIELTQGYYTIVDREDYERLNQYNWFPNKVKGKVYVVRNNWENKKNKSLLMHREIMGITDSKIHVDHRDGNTLDNRKSNLRTCTNAENSRNQKPKGGVSRFKGVHYMRGRKKPWMASITKNYKHIYLGYFKTQEAAAIAYNKSAIKLFGEFAYLNNIMSMQKENKIA